MNSTNTQAPLFILRVLDGLARGTIIVLTPIFLPFALLMSVFAFDSPNALLLPLVMFVPMGISAWAFYCAVAPESAKMLVSRFRFGRLLCLIPTYLTLVAYLSFLTWVGLGNLLQLAYNFLKFIFRIFGFR